MATLTRQISSPGGTVITQSAASGGGDKFKNSGVEVFFIQNADASPHTVTFQANAGGVAAAGGSKCSFGLAGTPAHDLAIVVGAGTTQLIGPFPTGQFNDNQGFVQISYSAVTSVTVALR